VLGVLGVLVLVVGPLFMGGMMGVGVGGPGMMGWGYAAPGSASTGNGWVWGLGMGLGGLMMLAFWGALLVGVVLLARWASGQWTGTTGSASAEDPLAILRRRYAAGEIDEPTCRRMRAELGEREGNAAGPVGANGRPEVPR
jgi:putative membrane protein